MGYIPYSQWDEAHLVLNSLVALTGGEADGLFANPTAANQQCAVLAKSLDNMMPNCTVCKL